MSIASIYSQHRMVCAIIETFCLC